MAMVALSIIELSSHYSDQDTRTKIATLLEEAFQIDDSNPLVLRYIADHYFT